MASEDAEARERLLPLRPRDADYAARFVDEVLSMASDRQATDVHFQPVRDGLDVRWRVDGALQSVGTFSRGDHTDIVTRIKVMADLLTYRTDIPQEGRIPTANSIERRVSTFPTLYGERAVIRLFASEQRYHRVTDLGLGTATETLLLEELAETSGALLVCGPAGSGKTTTVYACLRELVSNPYAPRSIVSLEDPIEVVVEGVAQAPINAAAGFDFPTGLRSLMRQDPEVIMIGEIRDRATAESAYAASLTGHLVLTTFHAGSSAEALSRLADMGVERYMLRSGTRAVLCQRLLRQLCDCKQMDHSEAARLGLPVDDVQIPRGCPECGQTGYRGRMLVAEALAVSRAPFAREMFATLEAPQMQAVAVAEGFVTQWQQALEAVRAGRTSPAEVRRVFGFPRNPL